MQALNFNARRLSNDSPVESGSEMNENVNLNGFPKTFKRRGRLYHSVSIHSIVSLPRSSQCQPSSRSKTQNHLHKPGVSYIMARQNHLPSRDPHVTSSLGPRLAHIRTVLFQSEMIQ